MPGIVHELQREALDQSVRVSDLLRKALLVARKLKVPEIEAWILNELNGYGDSPTVPGYRVVRGQVMSKNAYTGQWLPVVFEDFDDDFVDAMHRRNCGQPMPEIESILAKPISGKLTMQYAQKAQETLMKGAGMDLPPVLVVEESRLHGIVDAVRTLIVDWALKLEEQGIIGEDLSFSDADKRAASHVTINVGTMSHSQIQAATTNSRQTVTNVNIEPEKLLEFVANARSALDSLAMRATEIAELRSELDTLEAQARSPRPKESIVRESARSVRTILEGAAGNVAAQGLLIALRVLFGG